MKFATLALIHDLLVKNYADANAEWKSSRQAYGEYLNSIEDSLPERMNSIDDNLPERMRSDEELRRLDERKNALWEDNLQASNALSDFEKHDFL